MEAGNDQSLHLITVTESVNEEISATGATLKVRIAGSSFFSGREAMKKAAEVANFVEALKKGGVDEANIRLDGVTTSVERGLLTKSSSAQYDLTVTCPGLESLGPILAAVASQKTAAMSHIIWQYDQLDDTKSALLEQAVKRANEAASLIANTLQVRLLGAHWLTYQFAGADERPERLVFGRMKRKNSNSFADSADPFGQINLGHTAEVEISLTCQFEIEHLAISKSDPSIARSRDVNA